MTLDELTLINSFVLLLAAFSFPFGYYMYQVLERVPGPRFKSWFTSMNWKQYGVAFIAAHGIAFVIPFCILAFQHVLPMNPDGPKALSADLLYNTVTSFWTNTNLQHYSGESSLSYLSQLFGLMYLQFFTPAAGLAALAAISRLLWGKVEIGNFYLDMIRILAYILLPMSVILSLFLTYQGVPMSLEGAAQVTTLEGAPQTIARGPAALFIAIKQLGTNGGGFFGTNSAHPMENPTALSNLLENGAILLIPMACVWFFAFQIRRLKHGAVIFSIMLLLFFIKVNAATYLESNPSPGLAGLPVTQVDANLEGKEMRLGPTAGAFWAVSTTSTSNGSVAAMHDSLNPLTGLLPLIGMWLSVVFGGVGVGMINILLYVFVAVFIGGLMVGRTPEYLNRKLEIREVKLAMLALLLHPFLILLGTALFLATGVAQETILNQGAHGLSEVLYEFSSASANNGSGFEGLGDNTVAWNIATGLAMFLGRFIPILLPLAIAGSLAAKDPTTETQGTLRTDGFSFAALLLFTIILVGALLFLPAAILGPVQEALLTL